MRTIRALCLPLLSAAGLSLISANAHAQADAASAAQKGEFTVQRFEPAAGTNNFLSVAGVRMDGRWGFSAGVLFDYARSPFVVQSCSSQGDCSSPNATNATDTKVVSDMFTWNVMAAVSPAKRLQVGLRLPLSYLSGEGINPETGRGAKDGLKTFGLGDINLEAKVRVLGGAQDPFLLGLAGDISLPTGHATGSGSYLGNSSPITGGIRAIFDAHIKAFSIGANLRGVFRESATLGTTTVGPVDFRYGGAVGYRVSPIFKVMAEGFGSTQFQFKRGTNGLEALAAVEVRPLNLPLIFRAGGGAGVLSGVGVPVARALVGVTFVREIGDQDGDNVPDDKDACPTIAEDKDDFEDSDGCPDLDNDSDGIADDKDKCPNVAETVNGVDDADGCPDEVADRDKDGIPDNVDKCPEAGGKEVINRPGTYYGCPDTDHDGVPDHLDKCVKEVEDTDGFEDTDGCPDPDNDGDGVPDDGDECIDQPEVINGYKDTDGCPDVAPDKDKDGIPDVSDKCPEKPENYNGFEDTDGCPDKGVALVQVGDAGIKILQRVEFATSSDKIQGAKSFQVLDAVVGAMKGHPDIFLLEVAGHTDNAGSAADNRVLSQKRADAVVAYVVSKGIDAKRLQAKGYGPDKPMADNKTILGRQKNRRVEFNILRSAKNPGVVVAQPPPAPPPAATPAPAPPPPPAPGKAPAPKK